MRRRRFQRLVIGLFSFSLAGSSEGRIDELTEYSTSYPKVPENLVSTVFMSGSSSLGWKLRWTSRLEASRKSFKASTSMGSPMGADCVKTSENEGKCFLCGMRGRDMARNLAAETRIDGGFKSSKID